MLLISSNVYSITDAEYNALLKEYVYDSLEEDAQYKIIKAASRRRAGSVLEGEAFIKMCGDFYRKRYGIPLDRALNAAHDHNLTVHFIGDMQNETDRGG